MKIFVMDEGFDICKIPEPKLDGKSVNVKAHIHWDGEVRVVTIAFTYVFQTEVSDLVAEIKDYTNLAETDFYLVYNGKLMEHYRRLGEYLDNNLCKDVWLTVRIRGGGGKRGRAVIDDGPILFNPVPLATDHPLVAKCLSFTDLDLPDRISKLSLDSLQKLQKAIIESPKPGQTLFLVKPYLPSITEYSELQENILKIKILIIRSATSNNPKSNF